MAAPSVSTSTYTTVVDTGDQTSRTISVPSDAANKAVYIWSVLDGVEVNVASSGFTAVIDNVVFSSTASITLLRKEEGASPPSTYTITSDSERIVAICFCVDGDGGVDGSTHDLGTGTTATCPTLTPSVVDCLALLLVGTDGQSTPHSTVSGYTFLAETDGFSAGSVSVQFKALSTTDPTGDNDVTINASEQWRAATVVIAPAAGSTSAFPGASFEVHTFGVATF